MDGSIDEKSGVDVTLTVHEGRPADADRGIVRLDPAALAAIGADIGDVVAIIGARTAYARAMPALSEQRGRGLIAMDGTVRANASVVLGGAVRVTRASAQPAARVALALRDFSAAPSPILLRQIGRSLENVPVRTGDTIRIPIIGGRVLEATVASTRPDGVAMIGERTQIAIERPGTTAQPKASPVGARGLRYEDLGGLSRELARVREMIEWPMRHGELFAHLGIDPPKGVLLIGPPGTGKTLLAKAVASECNATFFQINGPEIVSKHYGESEEQLRSIFKRAEQKAPSIVFIDEIDAIAPKREGLAGDRQVERRIVAQLLTLLDGMQSRGQVIVMAATNLPGSLDPALRRPGRFDREIAFSPPDRVGRREILDVHTRGMPLAESVDLDRLAAVTHGYVGADLAALAREAGMAALRRLMTASDGDTDAAARNLDGLDVRQSDFDTALNEVGPSAVREVSIDIPTVRFDDVGGAENVKQTLIEAIVWPLTYPALFDAAALKPAGGLLLCGPPGTGKTLIAKAVAHESGVNFIGVRGPQLLNQYVGESERAVRDVFAKARMVAPAIIFFDEVDAIAPRRGSGEGAVVERVVAQLLTEMDGIEERRGVFVLAATNRPDRVDAALLRPGRFDQIIEVPVPDLATRRSIYDIHTRHRKIGGVDLDALARSSEGLVGADIEAVCRIAALSAVRRAIASGRADALQPIEPADFDAALAQVRRRGSPPEGKS
jgi:transitional endoplasmic reticulum ATPase